MKNQEQTGGNTTFRKIIGENEPEETSVFDDFKNIGKSVSNITEKLAKEVIHKTGSAVLVAADLVESAYNLGKTVVNTAVDAPEVMAAATSRLKKATAEMNNLTNSLAHESDVRSEQGYDRLKKLSKDGYSMVVSKLPTRKPLAAGEQHG